MIIKNLIEINEHRLNNNNIHHVHHVIAHPIKLKNNYLIIMNSHHQKILISMILVPVKLVEQLVQPHLYYHVLLKLHLNLFILPIVLHPLLNLHQTFVHRLPYYPQLRNVVYVNVMIKILILIYNNIISNILI